MGVQVPLLAFHSLLYPCVAIEEMLKKSNYWGAGWFRQALNRKAMLGPGFNSQRLH